jgi:hypothetical protein
MLSNISPATETSQCGVVWNYARRIQQGMFCLLTVPDTFMPEF